MTIKSIFEQVEGDYLIPNLTLPDSSHYQIGKYCRMRRSYLKEHCKVLYTNFVVEGTLFKHLAEIDQACNERMEAIVSAMAKQENVWRLGLDEMLIILFKVKVCAKCLCNRQPCEICSPLS